MKENWEGKEVLVIGAGKSGMGAAGLLLSAGAKVTLYDANEALSPKELKETLLASIGKGFKEKQSGTAATEKEERLPAAPAVEIFLGEFPKALTKKISLAILSPGVPADLPYIQAMEKQNIPVWGELELAWHFERGEVLAVTGTNGKTTTTALLGHLMRTWKDTVWVVGNIGRAYTAAALKTAPESVTVAEVSSFQLEKTVDFHPSVSAILNITPDHLNRHHTMEAYEAVKESITKNQDGFDTCVLNFDDARLRAFGEKLLETEGPRVIFFSSREALEHGFYLEGETMVYDDGRQKEILGHTGALKLIGRHNYENVLAASAMAMAAGVPLALIREALPSFAAVEHRIEYVDEVNGVRYYNDSKGTNPDAAMKAVEAMERPTYLMGGGYDKNADYGPWIASFKGKVKALVLVGETKEKIYEAAQKAGFTDCVLCESFEEAFSYCAYHAVEGEAVLLSPACAAWGMFRNYEERGRVFKALVQKLKEA